MIHQLMKCATSAHGGNRDHSIQTHSGRAVDASPKAELRTYPDALIETRDAFDLTQEERDVLVGGIKGCQSFERGAFR